MRLSDAYLGDEVVVYIGVIGFPVDEQTNETKHCTIIAKHKTSSSYILGSIDNSFGYGRTGGTWSLAGGYDYIKNEDEFTRSILVNDFIIHSIIGKPQNTSTTISDPINDHICAMCKNDRCSKTEKSCWRCGAPIK